MCDDGFLFFVGWAPRPLKPLRLRLLGPKSVTPVGSGNDDDCRDEEREMRDLT